MALKLKKKLTHVVSKHLNENSFESVKVIFK